jgi:hypothetical protein
MEQAEQLAGVLVGYAETVANVLEGISIKRAQRGRRDGRRGGRRAV